MIVLLSPSKTQDFAAKVPEHGISQPMLLNESQVLMKELGRLSVERIGKLMTVSEKIASLNYERYHNFQTPFSRQNAKQAIFAFQGDVYDGFRAADMDIETLEFAQTHIRILSGLYGILKPLDLIQPYRLEMKIKLANPRGKDLYAFWDDRLTRLVAQDLSLHKSKVLINLASQEYFKAIHAEALDARIITPEFKEKKSGGYKMIALFAKKARGSMARYIAEQRITHPEALQFFAEDGYRLNVKLSAKDKPVYTRG